MKSHKRKGKESVKYAKGTLVIERGHILRHQQYQPHVWHTKNIVDWVYIDCVGVRTTIDTIGRVNESSIYQLR